MLFAYYIDELAQIIGGAFHTFYFADDLATICMGLRQVKKVIAIVEEWGKKNFMVLNKKKCGIFKIKKRSKKAKIDENQNLEEVVA